jgi:hypothetical protein
VADRLARHRNGKAPTGRWVVERVVHVLYEALRDGNPDTVATNLTGVSLGVVTALKLLVRLETSGTVVLTAAPECIEAIEESSDGLAEEFFDQLAGEVFGVGAMLGRLGLDRFARTEDTLTFRLAPPLAIDETTPEEVHDAITTGIADRVVSRMMTLLERTMRTLDGKAVMIGKLAFIVGFAASAKMLMAFWGRNSIASGIETIAELASDARYQELLTQAGTN